MYVDAVAAPFFSYKVKVNTHTIWFAKPEYRSARLRPGKHHSVMLQVLGFYATY